jgi:ribosome-associated translation inhibitor RaiA
MSQSITFKKLFPTDQVIELVTEKQNELEKRFGQSSNCNVVVEKPKRKPRKQSFQVRVFWEMPTIKKNQNKLVGLAESRELLETIKKAFEGVERQLCCTS